MSDGERLVMYAPMAELRRNEELTPPYCLTQGCYRSVVR